MKEKIIPAAIYTAVMLASTAVSFQIQYVISKKAAKKAIEEAADAGIVTSEPAANAEDEEI